MLPISDFTKEVMRQVRMIPEGKVASYKQIAELAGKPGASRGVAWILNSCSRKYKLPWHRVLSSKGTIAFDRKSTNFRLQRKLLEAEGVEFLDVGKLDLSKFQWKKKARKKARAPKMFQTR